MKNLLLLGLLLASGLAHFAAAQAPFSRRYDITGPNGSEYAGTLHNINGEIFLTIPIARNNSPDVFRFQKLDYLGVLQWHYDIQYDSTHFYYPNFQKIYKSNDSTWAIPIVKEFYGPDRRLSVIHYFNQNGFLGERLISNPGRDESVTDFALLPEGGAMASFNVWGGFPLVRKYNAAWEVTDTLLHSNPANNNAWGPRFVPLPNGEYLYCYRRYHNWERAYAFGRASFEEGILWEEIYYAPSYTNSVDILLTPDNRVVVSGRTLDRDYTDNSGDYVLESRDLDGNFQWRHVFSSPGWFEVYAVATTADGDIIGGGESNPYVWEDTGGVWPAWMFRISPEGELRWQRYYIPDDNDPNVVVLRFWDVEELDDGRIAACGPSAPLNSPGEEYNSLDAWLIAVGPDGCLEPGCGEGIIVSARDPAAAPEALQVAVFPNPATAGYARVLHSGTKATVQLLDTHGRLLYSTPSQGHTQLDLRGLAPGMYYVRITQGGQVETRKLAVQ